MANEYWNNPSGCSWVACFDRLATLRLLAIAIILLALCGCPRRPLPVEIMNPPMPAPEADCGNVTVPEPQQVRVEVVQVPAPPAAVATANEPASVAGGKPLPEFPEKWEFEDDDMVKVPGSSAPSHHEGPSLPHGREVAAAPAEQPQPPKVEKAKLHWFWRILFPVCNVLLAVALVAFYAWKAKGKPPHGSPPAKSQTQVAQAPAPKPAPAPAAGGAAA